VPHMQIRAKPSASPADLELFLRPLADAGINILAAGGSDVELDGEVGIGVGHGDLDRAEKVLQDAGYQTRQVPVYECWMDDVPGELHRCVREASAQNLEAGRVIKDFAIGTAREEDRRILVQIYSVDVRSLANTVGPHDAAAGTEGSAGS
jgi:hypothetical protein